MTTLLERYRALADPYPEEAGRAQLDQLVGLEEPQSEIVACLRASLGALSAVGDLGTLRPGRGFKLQYRLLETADACLELALRQVHEHPDLEGWRPTIVALSADIGAMTEAVLQAWNAPAKARSPGGREG